MSHNHIDTRVRLPEDCPSCKKLWDILARAVPDVRKELEFGRQLREQYGEDELLFHLTDKADYFQRQKWHQERYA